MTEQRSRRLSIAQTLSGLNRKKVPVYYDKDGERVIGGGVEVTDFKALGDGMDPDGEIVVTRSSIIRPWEPEDSFLGG